MKTSVDTLKDYFKKYSRFYFHGKRVPDAPSWSDPFTFTLTVTHSDHQNKEHDHLELPGMVHGGHNDALEWHKGFDGREFPHASEGYRPTTGFWSLFSGEEYFRNVVEMLPSDAELSIEVYLDAGTNEILMREHLHHDRLILNAHWKRGKKEFNRTFLIDSYCGRHNSARFGDAK